MKKLILYIVLIFTGFAFLNFSIFSDENSNFRKYLVSDLPFVYQIHESVQNHPDWEAAIIAGANEWNTVTSAYVQLSYGGYTTVSSVGNDGVNLVYFDENYDNFTPGSNVIAFSRTFTTGTGDSWHAVGSDLIWNAGDFPPGTQGESNRQDVASVVTHEFGHHIGLGHTGDAGNDQPGAGDVIDDAVMYYASAPGDTSKRHLHIDDYMGCTAIYPRVYFTGTIRNPQDGIIGNATLTISPEVEAAYLTVPQYFSWMGGYQVGGYVENDIFAASDGNFRFYTDVPQFDVAFSAFGYKDTIISVNIADFESLIDNEVQLNVVMYPTERFNIQVNAFEPVTMNPVSGEIIVRSQSDPTGQIFLQDTIIDGAVNLSLPAGVYDITVNSEFPYQYKIFRDIAVNSNSQLDLTLEKGTILLVDDDFLSGMDESDHVESYYIDALTELDRYAFTYWDKAKRGFSLDSAQLSQYSTIIWFVGKKSNVLFDAASRTALEKFLNGGGNVFMTGQRILAFNRFYSFFRDYLKVDYVAAGPDNITLYADPGHSITAGFNYVNLNNPDYSANNQAQYEEISLESELCQPLFYYYPWFNKQIKAAMAYEDTVKHYKVVYFGFGWEALSKLSPASESHQLRKAILENILIYFETPLEISDESAPVLSEFKLLKNYPNPFNSTNTIEFYVHEPAKVEVNIYNIMGQLVKTLHKGSLKPGWYKFRWDGSSESSYAVPSGLYVYKISVNNKSYFQKALLMK
ncbi:MAG: hypothetical protein Kow00108_17250 [Calditrichia bacterium]